MKQCLIFMACIATLLACSPAKQSGAPESAIGDSLQVADTTDIHKALNDIRFEGWEKKDWLDNEYIRTLRRYLDDYAMGKVSNPDLEPYKEQVKSQFVIYDINAYLLGGAFIRITFLDMPDNVLVSCRFTDLVDKNVFLERYFFHSFHNL